MSKPSKGQKGLDLGELVKLRWGGLQNMLRLRTEYKFNDKLTGEIGADFNAQQKFMLPFLCLDYRLHAKGRNLGALRVHNRGIAHRKSIPISFKGVSTTLITNVGANFAGPLPELGIDFAEVRPKWLVAVGAAALLAMGRPISGSHRFPDNFHVGIPLTAGSSAKTQGEGAVSLMRSKKGLTLNFNQLNAVVRM
eukprot:jgi/Astpho2/7376/Aster-01967